MAIQYLLNKSEAQKKISEILDHAHVAFEFKNHPEDQPFPDELQFCHTLLSVRPETELQTEGTIKMLQAVSIQSDDLNKLVVTQDDKAHLLVYSGKLK